MAITIELPSALQPFAGGSVEVTLHDRCRTVGDALGALSVRHGGVVDRVLNERGEIRQHVNVFVDGDNVKWLEGLSTPLDERSTIVIVPAVSGG